jgi:SAM-dependent methyltransferase
LDKSTQRIYDRFAPIYDEWNARNDYEMWLGETLLPELEQHGLRKGWALDVGCGTGRAFPPLLARGWRVIGCDVSAGMLTEARRKFDSQVQLLQVDARSLTAISPPGTPVEGAFELILFLNDIVNYLVEKNELQELFSGIKRNLHPDHGLFVFDANTLRLFREDYAVGVVDERGGAGWKWSGETASVESGGTFEGRLAVPDVEDQVHRQRHWPPEQMVKSLEAAGLQTLAVLGQSEERDRVVLRDPWDEQRDRKVVYIAGHLRS